MHCYTTLFPDVINFCLPMTTGNESLCFQIQLSNRFVNPHVFFFTTENRILNTIKKLFHFVIQKNGEKKWKEQVAKGGGLLIKINDFSFHRGF